MVYMITSTTLIDRAHGGLERPEARQDRFPFGGFTLLEVIVSMTLSGVLMVGVLSSFLMMGRSGMNAANYSLSETELRRGIEEFSQDVRMAKDIKWNSANVNSSTSVTLTVIDNYTANANKVTYAWDALAGTFYRSPGDASSGGAKTVLVTNVVNLQFSRFDRKDSKAKTDASTKRLQIDIAVSRRRNTLVAASTRLVTASYTLRNKVIN
jgi:prepilin-type N-terminal cleavage/methylation domain-containing protein